MTVGRWLIFWEFLIGQRTVSNSPNLRDKSNREIRYDKGIYTVEIWKAWGIKRDSVDVLYVFYQDVVNREYSGWLLLELAVVGS